jgi:hypothetical protein
MVQSLFISHAGADSKYASQVALALRHAGFGVVIDQWSNHAGDDVISFIERGLTECSYCLLLWSAAAAETPFVRMEWQAALYRTIREARRFLLIGRLEDYPLPTLLAPRLFVDLFPEMQPGLEKLVSACTHDRIAAEASGKPVGTAAVELSDATEGTTIYITSELFQLTLPLRVSLDVPVGVHIDRLISELALPRQHGYRGLLGVRYEYGLLHEERPLRRETSLAAQGVGPNAVLWLEIHFKAFADDRTFHESRFRSDALEEARETLIAALSRAGLHFSDSLQ